MSLESNFPVKVAIPLQKRATLPVAQKPCQCQSLVVLLLNLLIAVNFTNGQVNESAFGANLNSLEHLDLHNNLLHFVDLSSFKHLDLLIFLDLSRKFRNKIIIGKAYLHYRNTKRYIDRIMFEFYVSDWLSKN